MHIAALLTLSCGGSVDQEPESQPAPLCAWEEPLGDGCARVVAEPGTLLSLEGRSCEPVSCLVVPFGENEGTVQQVVVSPPERDGFSVEFGACSELACD